MDRVKSSNSCNGYPLRKSLIGMALELSSKAN